MAMIERSFGTLKAERVWLHRFEDRDHAFRVIVDWIDHYHEERQHQALDDLMPREYAARLAA
jgi:transposase InsO family protein